MELTFVPAVSASTYQPKVATSHIRINISEDINRIIFEKS